MQKQIKQGGIVYRLKCFINGWEETEWYFRSIERFTENELQDMADGKTISKNGNEFRIIYESEYGNEYTVTEMM